MTDIGLDGAHLGDGNGLAEMLSKLARSLASQPDMTETLNAIAVAAVADINAAEQCGVSLLEGGSINTVASTGDLVGEVDELQYEVGEGPCLDAIRDRHTYRTGDMGGETRWPRFAGRAADAGLRSMLSFRLFTSKDTLGALNIYSSRLDAFTEDDEHDGELFAAHAAVALTSSRKEAQLRSALKNRDIIGMAKGILMERENLDSDAAFGLLVSASQHANLKLHEVANWLVTERNEFARRQR
jgi:GAF domain-containing protein